MIYTHWALATCGSIYIFDILYLLLKYIEIGLLLIQQPLLYDEGIYVSYIDVLSPLHFTATLKTLAYVLPPSRFSLARTTCVRDGPLFFWRGRTFLQTLWISCLQTIYFVFSGPAIFLIPPPPHPPPENKWSVTYWGAQARDSRVSRISRSCLALRARTPAPPSNACCSQSPKQYSFKMAAAVDFWDWLGLGKTQGKRPFCIIRTIFSI